VVRHAYQLVRYAYQLVRHAYQLVRHAYQLVRHAYQLVRHAYQLVIPGRFRVMKYIWQYEPDFTLEKKTCDKQEVV